MKILALEKKVPGKRVEEFAPYLKEEAKKVWELHQGGAIREIYLRADAHDVVMVLECRDVREAGSMLSSLPLVRANLIEFDLIPLAPYPGFSRLFG